MGTERFAGRVMRVLRAGWNRPLFARADLATLVMGYIATVTAGTGLAYLLPSNTFGLSPSFTVLRGLGGETLWGVIIWSVGLLALIATWLEWHTAALERARLTTLPPALRPERRFGTVAWTLVSVLWTFVGGSFLVTVPFSPGAISYVCLGILAQIVATTARKRRDAGIAEGDAGA